MADLCAYLANCLVAGHTMTRNANSLSRDTIEFNCGRLLLVLKQDAEVVSGDLEKLKGRFCETSKVVVRDVAAEDVPTVLKVVDRLCWLLSFAGLSRVLCYRYEYPDGSGLGTHHTVFGVADYFRPTFDIRDGQVVKSFVEQTYPNFVRLEQSRKLNVVIDYFLQAERQNQPTECRLIFTLVLLENLKYTYAHAKPISFVDGHFIKPNGERYSFKELLKMMFREVDMRPDLSSAVSLRNEIIHSGLSQEPHHQQWAMYEKIHDLLREYILRLLDFHGTYLVYSSDSNAQAAV